MPEYSTYKNGKKVSPAKKLKVAEKVASAITKKTRGSADVEVFKVGSPTIVKDRSMQRIPSKGRW